MISPKLVCSEAVEILLSLHTGMYSHSNIVLKLIDALTLHLGLHGQLVFMHGHPISAVI